MIYLDNAATTIKKPDAVYDAVLDAMKHCGNSGRGMSDASLDASRKIYEARMCLTEFFGGEDADRLVFTANSTESLNIAIHGLLEPGGACDYDTARAQFGAQTSLYAKGEGSVRGYCAMQ